MRLRICPLRLDHHLHSTRPKERRHHHINSDITKHAPSVDASGGAGEGVPLLVLAVVTLLFQDSKVHPHANRLGAKAHGYRQERVEPGAASKRQNPRAGGRRWLYGETSDTHKLVVEGLLVAM